MSPDRWQRVETLYHAALELEPESRETFLSDACADDADLRYEVESLLSQGDAHTSPLDRPAWSGGRFGPYMLLGKLGSGGMGEVYRAVDTRLNRAVALKVMKAPFSDRFQREALAIAALNHPHVCTLYDVGPDYLVMEYVEGRPLKGPLSLDESLETGGQICEALEAAHQAGVIHRDLKPSNILVTKLGIKLLDFGIARFSNADNTITPPGELIGTPTYLAPEVWKGKPADARSDIYSFGCVMHELVTGSRALTAVLEPPALDQIVRACLAEDPDARWQSARDVKIALSLVGQSVDSPQKSRRWLWAAAVTVAAAIFAGVSGYLTSPPVPVANYRFEIQPPHGTRFILSAISPDATMIVFRTGRPSGQSPLLLRHLDGLENRLLPGTEEASGLVWSPDSRQVAFAAGGKIKRIDVNTGNIKTICDCDSPLASTWNDQGVLLIIRDRVIHRVGASGGVSVPVTRLVGNDASHGSPSFLPDGRHFLFTVSSTNPAAMAVYVSSLDAPEERKRLMEAGPTRYVYVSSTQAVWGRSQGYILAMSGGTLVAQPFDPHRLEVRGDPFPIAENISAFSASAAGAIATRQDRPADLHRLIWRDRHGMELSAVNEPVHVDRISLTQDGNRLAYLLRDGGGRTDIWLRDLRSVGVPSRLPTKGEDFGPVWSPDGVHLAFALSGFRGSYSLFRVDPLSAEPENMGVDGSPSDWSRDGAFILLNVMSPVNFLDLQVFELQGKKLVPFVDSPLPEWDGQFSPEKLGPPRWIAYTMAESHAAPEVYVQRFLPGRPAAGQRWKVSTAGGILPKWRADGKELFYRQGSKLSAVPVGTTQDQFQIGPAVTLFETLPGPDYAVTHDGMRFLLVEPIPNQQSADPSPITVTLNWQANSR